MFLHVLFTFTFLSPYLYLLAATATPKNMNITSELCALLLGRLICSPIKISPHSTQHDKHGPPRLCIRLHLATYCWHQLRIVSKVKTLIPHGVITELHEFAHQIVIALPTICTFYCTVWALSFSLKDCYDPLQISALQYFPCTTLNH